MVWSVEQFKNYVYGVSFEIVSDHKALQSVLKSNKGSKRLTGWVDRLLPFEFSIVHTPGRILGLVDYLSRHPLENEGAVAKAEDLFTDWFTVNVLEEISPKLPRLADQRKPIKLRENEMVKRMNTSCVLAVHEPVQTFRAISEVAETPINAKMAEAKDLSNSKNSNVYVKANAENDRLIQNFFHLLKN